MMLQNKQTEGTSAVFPQLRISWTQSDELGLTLTETKVCAVRMKR